jgi:CrcB protein
MEFAVNRPPKANDSYASPNAWESFRILPARFEARMNLVWYVAFGSAVGGASRFALSTFIQQRAGTFPVGTLVVNITGSLILGFLMRYALGSTSVSAETRALLTTGFCGGYTTFSTLSYETIALIEDGDYRRAAMYVVVSVVLSLAATFLGIVAANAALGARVR